VISLASNLYATAQLSQSPPAGKDSLIHVLFMAPPIFNTSPNRVLSIETNLLSQISSSSVSRSTHSKQTTRELPSYQLQRYLHEPSIFDIVHSLDDNIHSVVKRREEAVLNALDRFDQEMTGAARCR